MAKRSGFTLLELVIVLICIAIVIAILSPVRTGHRERPLQSYCLSNLKQMGLAAMQYVQDYDETLPASGFPAVKIKEEAFSALPLQVEKPADAWYEELYPYSKYRPMYYCPSDESKQWKNYPAPAQPDEYATSYTMNRWTTFGLKWAKVKAPSEFILLAERNNPMQTPNGSYLFAPWNWRQDAAQMGQDLALTRHHEGSVITFLDGHSKWFNARRMNDALQSGAFHP